MQIIDKYIKIFSVTSIWKKVLQKNKIFKKNLPDYRRFESLRPSTAA